VLRTGGIKPHNPHLGYATHRCGEHIGA